MKEMFLTSRMSGWVSLPGGHGTERPLSSAWGPPPSPWSSEGFFCFCFHLSKVIFGRSANQSMVPQGPATQPCRLLTNFTPQAWSGQEQVSPGDGGQRAALSFEELLGVTSL